MSVKQLTAGKHSCVGHLSAGGVPTENKARLEKPAMLVYCGKFQSMDGEVEITEEIIDRIIANHNTRLEKLTQLATTTDHVERAMPPLQVDHSTSAHDTVGRVIGKLMKGQYLDENTGKVVASLMADKILVLGSDNVEKVADGRWCNISIGADLEAGTLNELSITPFPAAPNATLLKDGKRLSEGEKMETKEEMKARHLAEKEALATSHGEELKVHKLEEVKSKHEEQLRSLTEKHAEELRKLGVEPEEKQLSEEEKKLAADEEEKKKLAAEEQKKNDHDSDDLSKRMTAAKPKLIALAKGISAGVKSTRLAAREGQIKAKVARLRASAKMTPAEQKKLDIAALSKQSDAEVESFFKGYEIRENVIDPKIHGTTKALSLASLERMSKEKRLTRLEAEARHDMGMSLDEKQKAEVKDLGQMPEVQAASPAYCSDDEHMSQLGAMLAEHPSKDAVMAHVKKMMEMKHMGEVAPEQAESAEKQMSALVNEINKLQTDYQNLIALIGEAAGIQSAELTE